MKQEKIYVCEICKSIQEDHKLYKIYLDGLSKLLCCVCNGDKLKELKS